MCQFLNQIAKLQNIFEFYLHFDFDFCAVIPEFLRNFAVQITQFIN